MKSIILKENQTGGDFVVCTEKGIILGDYLQTAVYVSLFGGNVEENSREKYKRYEQNKGYFGNVFLSKKYNSDTERIILNSVNVVSEYETIKRAIRTDLAKLQPDIIKDINSIEVESVNLPKRIKIKLLFTTPFGETKEMEI